MTSSSDALSIADRLPLLCDLGWHRPETTPRWNNGYYFSSCARCGHDLIRTAFGKWHVPRGYRVVWQAQPPAGATSATLAGRETIPAPAQAPADDLEQRIVREVIRQLREVDPASDAPGPPPEPPPPPPEPAAPDVDGEEAPAADPPPAPRRSIIPDFMDDGWPAAPPPMTYRPLGVVHSAVDEPADPPEASRSAAFEMLRGWRDNARRMVAQPTDRPRRATTGRWQAAAVIGLFLIIVASAAWVLLDRGGAGMAERPVRETAAVVPSPTLPAFVTASTLNCRSAPARQAPSVARLTRGMPVEAIARDGEWVSLSYAGDQCWALGRYISLDRPI